MTDLPPLTRNLSVAIVRQKYNPYGGAERIVARAMQGLVKHGCELTVIAREWLSQQGEDKATANFSWLKVNPFYLGRTWRAISFGRMAKVSWQQHHFDLVQSHERIPGAMIYRAGDGVHAEWLAQRSADSLLHRIVDRYSPYHRQQLFAERNLYTHPDLRGVICISEMVRNDILRYYDVPTDKLHVIYNGIDTSKFNPAIRRDLRQAARRRFGFSGTDCVAVFVGSGFSRKGLDVLLELLKAIPNLKALIVGKDKDVKKYIRKSYQLNVSSRCIFAGPQLDVRPYLSAADVFVLPTRYEPFSNAVLEALAMGLPAVVSNRCGAAEVVQKYELGAVCSLGNLVEWVNALKKINPSNLLLNQQNQETEQFQLFLKNFSLDAFSSNLLAFYHRMIGA